VKKILLVSPYVPSDVRAFWVTGGEGPAIDLPGIMVPLGLATLVALTPEYYRVEIWDECIRGQINDDTPFEQDYDLVGITGYLPHIPRVKAIAKSFRKRAIPVAVGGPGVSAAPHLLSKEDCDIMFIGEAEKTWPRFLEDWEKDSYHPTYWQIEKIDISDSPAPRWDSIVADSHLYANGCVQTTRGCPFDCEFCDVIFLYGRRPRHKPIGNVLREIKTLQELGMRTIFICDDEFMGDTRYTKKFLRQLIPLNNSFPQPISFRTQVTLNISKDEEVLRLMADANFDMLIIGIETPNQESLRETGKLQNIREDLVGDIHKIFSFGMGIRPGMIVGFDQDGPDIFDIQFKFIHQAYLPLVTLNMLKAPIGTRLWARLRQDGRMLNWSKMAAKNTNPNRTTNIIPKRMTRVELMKGFRDLQIRLHTWESFKRRMLGMISLVKRKPKVQEDPMPVENLTVLGWRLGLEPDGCRAIEEIMLHTAKVAPFMWKRVRSFIGTHVTYVKALPRVIQALDEQIRGEESGQIKIELDRDDLFVPQSFRDKYEKVIFPNVYRRTYLNLVDKTKIPDALKGIFVDFLIRWGKDLAEFGDYHMELLYELADSSCASANGKAREFFVAKTSADQSMQKPSRQLKEDVLKSVGQHLIMIAQGGRE